MLAVDNQATGLLFIHDNIRRRIDAHRAFRALFPAKRANPISTTGPSGC
jgi:hypothetical protein